MLYLTDQETLDSAKAQGELTLLEVCKQYRAEHQAYWWCIDNRVYADGDHYRAKHHWRRVRALSKRIKEQGKAEGVDGWAFYSAHLGD